MELLKVIAAICGCIIVIPILSWAMFYGIWTLYGSKESFHNLLRDYFGRYNKQK